MSLNHSNSSNLLENNIKLSFSKAKEHILALETEIFSLKEVIFKQNEVLKQLSDRFLDISNQLQNLKSSQNQPISTGSEGVNQSINHLINQSISTKSLNHTNSDNLSPPEANSELDETIIESISEVQEELKKPEISVEKLTSEQNFFLNQLLNSEKIEEKPVKTSEFKLDLGTIIQKMPLSILNEEILVPKEQKIEKIEDLDQPLTSTQSERSEGKIKQSLKDQDFKINLDIPSQKKQLNLLDKEISNFKTNINKAFSSLSKQELRVFLTLYQLDDELNGVSYIELASKLELTEPCIRGYISTLIKKDLPITRTKLNNKRTILIINKEFKSLGLKQKLVSLYYEADPRQTTLFDLKL